MLIFSKRKYMVAVFAAIFALAAFGCQRQEVQEVPLDEKPVENVPMPQVPSTVKVPDEIVGKWKAVVLEVTDKTAEKSSDVTVNIGETAALGESGLNIYVEAFLPHFTMAGQVFTSASAELVNPAVRARITDAQEKELFYGWFFSLYPDTHPFEHSTYKVVLKDYVAAK